jgi:hypothetical protein
MHVAVRSGGGQDDRIRGCLYRSCADVSITDALAAEGGFFLQHQGHHDISLDLGSQVLVTDSVHREEQEVAYDDL